MLPATLFRVIVTASMLPVLTLATPNCWTGSPWNPLDVSACQRVVSTLADFPLTNTPQMWGTGDWGTPFRLNHDGSCKLTLYRDLGSPHPFWKWAISDYESEIIELVRECVAGRQTRGGTVGVGPGDPARFFLNMANANANARASWTNASSWNAGVGHGDGSPAAADTA